MTINNERLFHFANPKGCWHEWNIAQYCKVCGVSRHGNDNPSYSTSPADRERLLEYLMGKKEMWRYFQDWTCDVWEEDIDLVERGTSWNTEADRAAWLHKPLDGVPRWVSLLSEWLRLESVREKFGTTECPTCENKGGTEVLGFTVVCPSCNGSGKIRAEWAKEE